MSHLRLLFIAVFQLSLVDLAAKMPPYLLGTLSGLSGSPYQSRQAEWSPCGALPGPTTEGKESSETFLWTVIHACLVVVQKTSAQTHW